MVSEEHGQVQKWMEDVSMKLSNCFLQPFCVVSSDAPLGSPRVVSGSSSEIRPRHVCVRGMSRHSQARLKFALSFLVVSMAWFWDTSDTEDVGFETGMNANLGCIWTFLERIRINTGEG